MGDVPPLSEHRTLARKRGRPSSNHARQFVDPTNPIDFGPVELLDDSWLEPFRSGAQLIEAEAPADAALVKAFNTNFAGPLLAGGLPQRFGSHPERGRSAVTPNRPRG